mgnify:CR=1 FL=1
MVLIYFQDHQLLFTMRTDQRIIAKRRKDRSTPPVKTTESIAKESIVEMRDITPESIITVTAFRDETMDMRIPFKIPAESMQDHDKTRGKVFVFVHFRE